MGQTTIVLMLIKILSKILGFVRESVMAAFIGAGDLKSIYTTAITVPTFLSGIVVSAVASGYIPIFNKAKVEEGEATALDFTNNLLNILMVIGAIFFLISLLFAKPISKLFSPDLEGESLVLAINFSRIISFSIFAFLYASVMRGYLNIKGNFYDPTLVGLILNLLIVISTVLTGKLRNPYILIIGALIAYVFQFVRFPFAARKLGFRYKRKLDFKDKYIISMVILIIPIIISSAADQLSLIVDNSMGSAFFGKESVSKIFYAKTMLSFITGVVTMTIATVTFPSIAKLGQEGKINEMKTAVGSSMVLTMLLVIPATLGMMILSNPIIKLAFERNAFTPADTEIVASLMTSYAPYIIFVSVIKIFTNAFYAVGDSKIPVVIVLIQQGINFILNFILIRFFGIDGLAFATAISTALGSALLIWAFYKRFGRVDSKENIQSILKISVSSIIMAIIAYFMYNSFVTKTGSTLSLLVSVSVSGLVYLIIVYFSKIEEVETFKHSISKKLERK